MGSCSNLACKLYNRYKDVWREEGGGGAGASIGISLRLPQSRISDNFSSIAIGSTLIFRDRQVNNSQFLDFCFRFRTNCSNSSKGTSKSQRVYHGRIGKNGLTKQSIIKFALLAEKKKFFFFSATPLPNNSTSYQLN
jgi:hypothetical protein